MSEGTTHIKAVLEAFMKRSKNKSKLAEASIKESWSKVVGDVIANRTERIWVAQGVLHIVINSSVLKNELQFHKEKIVERVNKQYSQHFVKDIIIH
jgi:hypothetical protein